MVAITANLTNNGAEEVEAEVWVLQVLQDTSDVAEVRVVELGKEEASFG